MPKSKKARSTVVDRASDLAGDLADRISPTVERAHDRAAPLLAEARERGAAARDLATPAFTGARDLVAPVIVDARTKASPAIDGAKDRFSADVLPVLTAAVAAASSATEDVRDETRKRGRATVAALRGDVAPPKQTHRVRNLLVALGLGGIAFAIAKKVSDSSADSSWEAPPPPAPSPSSSTAPAAATTAGAHDQGGASPDVAAADAASGPHPASTPDDPAETVHIQRD